MLNFPSNPTVGQIYLSSPQKWIWDSEKWTGSPSTTPMYLPITGGALSGPGNLSVGGTLSVVGATALSGVTATTVVTSSDVSVGGALSVSGNISMSAGGFLGPSAYTFFGPNATQASLIQIDAANTTVMGNLNVSGTAMLPAIGSGGGNMVIGTGTTGNIPTLTIFANQTTFNGNITCGTETVTGNLNVYGGTFYNAWNNGWLYFNGSLQAWDFQSSNNVVAAGNLTANGGVVYLAGAYWQWTGEMWCPWQVHSGGSVVANGNVYAGGGGGVFFYNYSGWFRTNAGLMCDNINIAGNGCGISPWNNGVYIGGASFVAGDLHNDPSFWMYSGNFVQSSDERLKSNIERVPPGISDLIDKIEPRTYQIEAKGESARAPDGSKHWGFIAQDIERAMEEFGLPFAGVVTDEGGMKYLSYGELIAVVWAGLREVGQRLAALEAA